MPAIKNQTGRDSYRLIITSVSIACVLVLLLTSVPNVFSQNAQELHTESQGIREELAAVQSQRERLETRAETIEEAIEELDEEIAQSEKEIKRTQKQIDALQLQLEAAQAELEEKRALLRANVRILYKRGDVTTFELLASSDTFSEYIDEQEYLERVKELIQDATKAVLQIRLEIQRQQNEQLELLMQQETMKQSLADAKADREQLLNRTLSEADRLREYGENLTKRMQEINRELLRMSQIINTQGDGGYPWSTALCAYTDQMNGRCFHPEDSSMHFEWYMSSKNDRRDPWGYFYRNCTSYVAWRSAQLGFQLDLNGPGRRSLGDGGSWHKNAGQYRELSTGSEPKVGSFAVFDFPGFGHVAFVEEVRGDRVRISEYNFAPLGEGVYSERWIPRYQPTAYVYTPYSR